MSEKVLVEREQLERAASVVAWMSCRSDIKVADLKRLEQCASELSCALTAPAVQGGDWVLVPRTPTDAMLRAAQSAWLDDTLRRTTTMWLAMLAAAPQQPAEQQPAPDVARLVEALECARKDLSDWITSFPEAAHAHTTIVIARIDAALAAHRKQETSHDNQ